MEIERPANGLSYVALVAALAGLASLTQEGMAAELAPLAVVWVGIAVWVQHKVRLRKKDEHAGSESGDADQAPS